MPLVLIPKVSSSISYYKWRGLDYDPEKKLLVWRHTTETGNFSTIADQAAFLSSRFNICAYGDTDVLDKNDLANKLNNNNIRPDLSVECLELGWINPDGQFLGCEEGNHSNLLFHTFGERNPDRYKTGWIMVQSDYFVVFSDSGKPTEKQKETLKMLGFNLSGMSEKLNGNRTRIPRFDDNPKFQEDRILLTEQCQFGELTTLSPENAAAIIQSYQEPEGLDHNT